MTFGQSTSFARPHTSSPRRPASLTTTLPGFLAPDPREPAWPRRLAGMLRHTILQPKLAHKNPTSNSFIPSRYPNGAHLIDNERFQVPAFSYSCALFFNTPFIFSNLTFCIG